MACGVSRFVHCSSVHAFDLRGCGPELTEAGPRATEERSPAYDRSKNDGENEVRAAVAEGLDAVIVNPTGVVGPHDYAPSQMGELLLQFRDRKIPVNIGGGFDFVDVRDLVAGTARRRAVGPHRRKLPPVWSPLRASRSSPNWLPRSPA